MIRITTHPKDPTFLLLKVPQDLNSAMGSFGPAQLAVDLRGYVMPRDQLDALIAWARYQGVQMLNEAREPGEPTKALECGNVIAVTPKRGEPHTETCCAPYPTGRIPKFCGSCGQPANPVTYGDDEPDIGVKCPACSRLNHGGPAFCLNCATPLPERHLSAPAIPRVKGDPKPLAAAIAELKPHIQPAPSGALHEEDAK